MTRGAKNGRGWRAGRLTSLFLAIALLLAALPARAEIYFDAPPHADWERRPLLRVTVLATGQSDCMLLQCGGQAMMIDGGSEPFREKLLAAVQARGVKRFKYLLNTHFHDDHISGLYWLMRFGMKADEYLHPYEDYAQNLSQRHADALRQARLCGIPARQVRDGDELLLGEAVIRLHRYEDGRGTNGKSMIERVEFGDASLLLTADIIGDTQSYFLRALPAEELKADVLKAPHHGITPMVVKFLETIAPGALIMTNYRARVDRGAVQANARGIPTFYSGDGTVVLETDGDDWVIWQEGAE